MVVRINTVAGGTDIIPLDHAQWFEHPDGDDIAVCPIRLDARQHKAKFIQQHLCITKEVIDGWDIGPGDDVFIVGRFINHEGKQQNLPSVRFGCIAQMPNEPIVFPDGLSQESFLVEGRSIAGYSGSPIFVHLPPSPPPMYYMENGKQVPLPTNGISPKRRHLNMISSWLLGIDFCHIRDDEQIFSKLSRKPIAEPWYVKSNTGMMGVIPAWRLVEIIEGPGMKKIIDARAAQIMQQEAKSGVELDAAQKPSESEQATDNPAHRENFTSLLNAAAKAKPKA